MFYKTREYRGRVITTRVNLTKKQRRHAGRKYPICTIKAKKREIVEACLDPQLYWDDWGDIRDGMRDWHSDKSKLKRKLHSSYYFCDECAKLKKNNKKLRRLIRRRKIRKKYELEKRAGTLYNGQLY